MNLNRTFKGVGLLIAVYLVVARATGTGTVLKQGGDAGGKIIKILQGRD